MLKKLKPYLIACAISLAVGGLAALFTSDQMDLYERIRMPALAPPSILFPIVWTILYILMGISAGLVYQHRMRNRSAATTGLVVFGISLFINFWWSIAFFNAQWFLFAFIWLILLWISVLSTIVLYSSVDTKAAWLQVPYLLWVTFAGYLNLAIYLLNR